VESKRVDLTKMGSKREDTRNFGVGWSGVDGAYILKEEILIRGYQVSVRPEA
jgi:hypothetical protein